MAAVAPYLRAQRCRDATFALLLCWRRTRGAGEGSLARVPRDMIRLLAAMLHESRYAIEWEPPRDSQQRCCASPFRVASPPFVSAATTSTERRGVFGAVAALCSSFVAQLSDWIGNG